MPFKTIHNIPVWGEPIDEAINQIVNCAKDAEYCALMADHHPGYAVPIGGVVAYRDKISPSGVGYDIACGNKAVLTDMSADQAKKSIKSIMDDIYETLSFGVGMKNNERTEHPLFFDDPAWQIDVTKELKLKKLAQEQLGTVGSGNHYVDIFLD